MALCAGIATGAIAMAAVAPSGPSPDEELGAPASYGPLTRSQAESGMSIDDAINQTMSKMRGAAGIESVTVGDAPKGVQHDDRPWLSIKVAGADSEPEGMELAWQADLLQGAVTELARGAGQAANEVVAGASVDLQTSTGEIIELGGGAGYVATGQDFAVADSTDEEIAARVTATLERFDLKVHRVEVLHPLDAAVSVVAQTSSAKDPGWGIDTIREAIRGDAQDFEGLYIELLSPEGTPVLRSSVAYRTGTGRLWFAPGADETFNAPHGGVPR